MPGWIVRADWYVRDGSSGSRLGGRSVVRSNPSGVYEVQFSDPYLVGVDLRAVICTYNENDADCCLGEPPCSQPICSQMWIPTVHLTLGAGTRAQRTLTVPCDHVP
jgi:hypothetical protein